MLTLIHRPISRRYFAVLTATVLLLGASPSSSTYLGFDANDYPGDAALASLRRTFSFSGYWLNVPPGSKSNAWIGKRQELFDAGFGFLVLFNGRESNELKSPGNAAALGKADADVAVASARQEGFHSGAVIFLDQEEGGRMTDAQIAYIFSWTDEVIAGNFSAGIYCSGMPAKEGKETIVTANDIRARAGNRPIEYFVYNDACPPSPGCVYAKNAPEPSGSGVAFASVWQFAQSPRRREFTKHCARSYHADGNCYPPGADGGSAMLDLDSASSPDPSNGRR
jgi:Rv2525c-like, glycoside hydrolase-like domain